ncbi:MAG TPA: transglycosylase SLT domain-containing protein, partial [Longimicrobium sp.]|nr:transglycosylase SLT domain-containing protein [Longimicrobium sp.]
MQVMPDTGKWLAEKRGYDLGRTQNLHDTELNIELGTAYLASLIVQFGTVEHALVAYNAGPGAAKKILANREVRKTFIAGYPKKVVGEFKKLKARAEQNLAKRVASKLVNAG